MHREKKLVLFVEAKPRYLDMVSYFKAACKHLTSYRDTYRVYKIENRVFLSHFGLCRVAPLIASTELDLLYRSVIISSVSEHLTVT